MQITIDKANVNIENGTVTLDIEPAQLADLLNAGKVQLSTLSPGNEFKLGDEVFIVLEQTDNGTRVISKEFVYTNMKFGDSADWKTTDLRNTVLNRDYFNKIATIVGAGNILKMDRDLTSMDGLDDYGTCIDSISILTFAEYVKYHKILGLGVNYPDWWWLITPVSTPSNDYSRDVCYVGSNGVPGWYGCGWADGVRPFFTLESSIFVLGNKN